MRRAWLAIGLMLTLASPPASGDGAPPPADDHVHRVLEDHNDDCGDDADRARCRGTHDVLALDILERWDAILGDVLVLRLYVGHSVGDGGGGLREDVVTFRADGAERILWLNTTDGQAYDGTFTRIDGPTQLQDGTGAFIDGVAPLQALGLRLGTRLTSFAVDAYQDGVLGDFMPGGYNGTAGVVQDPPQGDPTNHGPVVHDVRGPGRFLTLDLPVGVNAPLDGTRDVEVQVGSLLRSTMQRVTLTATAPAGVNATWANGDGARYDAPDGEGEDGDEGPSARRTVTVEPNGHAAATLLLATSREIPTTVRVTAVSDLGLRTVASFAVTGVRGGGGGEPTPEAERDDGIPALDAAMLVLAVVAMARLARRGR